jgi:peptide/nickel transport system substrate-binding protein
MIHRPLLACLVSLSILVAWAFVAHATKSTLTYGLHGEPDTLDSAKMGTDVALHPAWLICDTLVNLSKDGHRLEPGLAESWTVSGDGLQARMKLRSGVQFHDGTPLDGEAVKESFERHFRPGHPLHTEKPANTREQLLRELVDAISVPDPSTVVFKLKYPGLAYLTQIDVISPTAAARLGSSFGRQPVCSGPFKFERWSGDRLSVIANDRYWAGRPRLDRVVFRVFHEPAALVEAMVKGEVDFSPSIVDPMYFEKIRGSARVGLVRIPSLNVTYLGFIVDRPPFNDPRVRRAVAHALDLPRMAVFLGRGAALPARGPLPPTVKGYEPTVSQASYDPAEGKALLARAGHASGLTVPLVHHEGYTIHAEVAGAIRSDLKQIGLTVDLVGTPRWGDLLSAIRAQERGMFLSAWNVRGPYPERILFPLFHSRSLRTTSYTRYSNPKLDSMLEAALRLPEGPDQQRTYGQVQKLIVDDAPMVFLYHAVRMAAVAERVQHLEMNLGTLPHDKLTRVDFSR